MATIKRYCSLAREAGMISHETLANIKLIKGYTPKEADRVDENREKSNEATRKDNAKKVAPTKVSIEASVELKKQPDSRDRLLMCLLVDHGFRCGEITGLKVSDIDMALRHICIKRPKVGNSGTQEMSVDVYNAMVDYLAEYKPITFLFMGRSGRTGEWGSYGVRAINRRVDLLGNRVGIEHLSPHDLRHFWAWYNAYRGISIHRLKQAGGWSTLVMPDRYIGRSEIENEGRV
jgi:integrase